MVIKRNFTDKWKTNVGSNILAKLEKERNQSAKWEVDWNGVAEHEMSEDDVLMLMRESYVVRFANNTLLLWKVREEWHPLLACTSSDCITRN